MAYKLPDIKDRIEEHPLYSSYKNEYQFIEDALYGGEAFVSKTYLIQHIFEDSEEFSKRLSRAWYFNIMRKLLSAYVEPIYREGVIRKGIEDLQSFSEDVTGYATPIDTFLAEAGMLSICFGASYIFVDYISNRDILDTISIEDEQDFPVLNLYSSNQLINWERRKRYGFLYATFKTKKFVDGDLMDVYVIVDYEKIYEVDENGEDIVKPYEHGLGFTPVVEVVYPFTYRVAYRQGFGLDLAYIMKGMLNNISLVDELGERQAFHQLTIPDDGSLEELQAKQSEFRTGAYNEDGAIYYDLNYGSPIEMGFDYTLKQLSRKNILTFPSNTGHPPNYISPGATGLPSVWKVVKDSIFLAAYIIGLQRWDGSFDMENVSSKIAVIAKVMEKVERKIFNIVGKYLGKDLKELEILYPDTFSLVDLNTWLDIVTKVLGLVGKASDSYVETLMRELNLLFPAPLSQIDKKNLLNSFSLEKQNIQQTQEQEK